MALLRLALFAAVAVEACVAFAPGMPHPHTLHGSFVRVFWIALSSLCFGDVMERSPVSACKLLPGHVL